MRLSAPIWDRIATPAFTDLSSQAARAILRMKLSPALLRRIHSLSALSKRGGLSDLQQAELDVLLQIGHLLTFMHSKARMALKPVAARKQRKTA